MDNFCRLSHFYTKRDINLKLREIEKKDNKEGLSGLKYL